jgi:hypothetical protein
VEDPALLDPDQRRSLEDQVRLSGYRRSLERLLRLQSRIGTGSDGGGGGKGGGDAALLDSIGSQYSISAQEEARILEAVSPAEAAHHRAEMLLQRLEDLELAARSLREPMLRHQPAPVALLADRLRLRQELCLSAILDCLVQLESAAERQQLLERLSIAAPAALPEMLEQERWRTKLPAALIDRLRAGNRAGAQPGPALPVAATLQQLERLAQDPDPIAATAAVVLSTSLDWQRGRSLAAALAAAERPAWVRKTAEQLLTLKPAALPLETQPLEALPIAALPEFEKRVVLATSDFFHRTWTDTLDLLADHAEIRSFAAGEAITAAGDSCRELLLLIEGEARVEERSGDQVRFRALRAGQVLDELEVLTHSNSENTIVAETAGTRVLAVPVDCFDATLERDPDFARRVLALETRQLQRVTRELPATPLS